MQNNERVFFQATAHSVIGQHSHDIRLTRRLRPIGFPGKSGCHRQHNASDRQPDYVLIF